MRVRARAPARTRVLRILEERGYFAENVLVGRTEERPGAPSPFWGPTGAGEGLVSSSEAANVESAASGISGGGGAGTGSTIGPVGESSTDGGAVDVGGRGGGASGDGDSSKGETALDEVAGAAGAAAGGGGGAGAAASGWTDCGGGGAVGVEIAVSRVGTNGNGSSDATPPESSPGWNVERRDLERVGQRRLRRRPAAPTPSAGSCRSRGTWAPEAAPPASAAAASASRAGARPAPRAPRSSRRPCDLPRARGRACTS